MIKEIKSRVWFLIQDHRRNRVVARLAQLCKNLHRAYEHPTHELERNGEGYLLHYLSRRLSPKVVLDVGANIGDWTTIASEVFTEAEFHLFEIAPVTFKRLQARLGSVSRFHINGFGLSSEAGEVSLTFCPDHPELSSADMVTHDVPMEVVTVNVETGDDYVKRNNLGRIDFLKIDTEGFEFKVLQGLKNTLQTQPPRVIQFEHFLGRFYLKDFYDYLGPLGYSIGKLYSRYVDFRAHDISMEDGIGPNYVAVHNSAPDLIREMGENIRL